MSMLNLKASRNVAWTSLCVGVLFLAQDLRAEARPVSLQECFEIALENNLTLQIERVNPELSIYDLKGSYGAYDPTFFLYYYRRHRSEPGNFNPTIGQIPGSQSDSDSFASGVGGLLPMGLSYNFSANITGLEGSRPTFDPVTGRFIDDPFSNTFGSASMAQLRQPLLKNFWIDGARLNIRIAKNQLQGSELLLAWRIMNVINQVEGAYYDLILAQENVTVQEKAVQLGEQLHQDNLKRFEAGAMAVLDVKQTEAQAASRRAELLSAQRLLSLRQNALKNLLSDEYTEWKGVQLEPAEGLRAVPEVFDLQDSWHQGMTQRPDLLQSRLNLKQQGIVVRFRRNQLFPQLDVVGSLGYSGSINRSDYSEVFSQIGNRDNPAWSVGAELRVPLTRRTEKNNYRAAKARAEQIKLQNKQLEQQVMVDIEDAVMLARINYQRIEATRQEREFAEEALEGEQKMLEVGRSTSFIVLQLQRDLTQARSNEIQALSDYNKAVSRLALLQGGILKRHGIDIEVEEDPAIEGLEPVSDREE